MFQNYITKHNSPNVTTIFRDAIAPTTSLPVVAPISLSSCTVDVFSAVSAAAANTGFGSLILVDDKSSTDNQVFSFAGQVTFSSPVNFIVHAVRIESAVPPVGLNAPNQTHLRYPIECNFSANSVSFKDCVTIPTRSISGNPVYVGLIIRTVSPFVASSVLGIISINQVLTEISVLQPLK